MRNKNLGQNKDYSYPFPVVSMEQFQAYMISAGQDAKLRDASYATNGKDKQLREQEELLPM